MRLVVPLLCAAAALTLAACGGSEPPPSTPPNAGPRGATVAVRDLPSTLDPARARSTAERAIAVATQTPLLTYRRTAGDAAATLEPALADALPTLSTDERTYRFQLRRGLVYADGRLVKASDVERAIAHASVRAIDPDLRAALASIDGAPSDDGQTLSGVVSDDRTGIVEVRLRRPDGRVPLALADPATGPLPELPRDGQAPASTGPLRIARLSRDSIELAANPLRPTISTVPAARLSQISVVPRPAGERPTAPRELRTGAIDLDTTFPVVGAIDPREGRGIARVSSAGATELAAYVPEGGALASRTLRRELAQAVDRRTLASPGADAPSCGLLPAFALGAVERDPCPAPPTISRRAPLTGITVRIWYQREDLTSGGVINATELMRAAVRNLGGTAQVKAAADPLAAAQRGPADLAVLAARPRLPHPALWLANAASVDRLLAREVPALTEGPLTGSAGDWSALERRVVERGVAIPLLRPIRTVVVGPDIDRRTVLLHPVLGLDLAALDIR